MSLYREVVLHTSGAETASGNSGAIDTFGTEIAPDTMDCRCYLDVTNASGTSPTLDITVNAVVGGQTYALGTFTQVSSNTTQVIELTNVPRTVQLNWDEGGTSPSFTFACTLVRG